ncbi:hypothetical protein L842_5675 [Mycobacterium intracellulare MIN_052511_1280]|nr:hypothetical protein L842_5675 [Mycobacterium intracellulare MIN_052511_1280]
MPGDNDLSGYAGESGAGTHPFHDLDDHFHGALVACSR